MKSVKVELGHTHVVSEDHIDMNGDPSPFRGITVIPVEQSWAESGLDILAYACITPEELAKRYTETYDSETTADVIIDYFGNLDEWDIVEYAAEVPDVENPLVIEIESGSLNRK